MGSSCRTADLTIYHNASDNVYQPLMRMNSRAQEIGQRLRAPRALSENQGSVPSIHTVVNKLQFLGIRCLLLAPMSNAHPCCTYTYEKQKFINIKSNSHSPRTVSKGHLSCCTYHLSKALMNKHNHKFSFLTSPHSSAESSLMRCWSHKPGFSFY